MKVKPGNQASKFERARRRIALRRVPEKRHARNQALLSKAEFILNSSIAFELEVVIEAFYATVPDWAKNADISVCVAAAQAATA